MKNYIFSLLFIGFLFNSIDVTAQKNSAVSEKKSLEKPYNPNDNAQQKIDALLKQAKKEKKNVILQAGGNWCGWCLLFNDFIKTNVKVKKELQSNFLYYHLNFSKENKNEAVFKKYAPNGDKLGYPFFIVLNSSGKVLKVQESGNLEEGKGYNETKVINFLKSVKP
ncbi:Thiol-disulfide isomerase or thioredoxin [Paenimyroides ummariense]|uniref:Thiol-disulfide isomerase or thioredoxin n=1 Tax=Paenimyroides ummariense TaxID=913024 RepID=A0A1I4Y6V1_9FLAO|nr:thioredoxin family protein [Paenimyroides ummariense]SFN33796.1 Thiol-disulfide isomerase or thioredoxin [Paenimyroides ummariense]